MKVLTLLLQVNLRILSGCPRNRKFYAQRTGPVTVPRPLLVALDSWSEGYKQTESVIYSEWAIANDWIFVHPHFRGPNVKPESGG